MSLKLARRMVLGLFLAAPAGLALGCNQGDTGTPALPPSTPAPPPLTGADAKKANNPTVGSSASSDPNPGAAH